MIYEPGFYKSDTMFDGSPYYIQILKSYGNGICDYLIKTPGYGIRLKHDNILYRLEINKMDFNNYNSGNMRYYYLIFDDNYIQKHIGFLITFNNFYKKLDHHPNQVFIKDKKRIIWDSKKDSSWIENVVEGGMSATRVFDSHNEIDCRRLISWFMERKDN